MVTWTDYDQVVIMCNDCGAEGPPVNDDYKQTDKDLAAQKWNERSPGHGSVGAMSEEPRVRVITGASDVVEEIRRLLGIPRLVQWFKVEVEMHQPVFVECRFIPEKPGKPDEAEQ